MQSTRGAKNYFYIFLKIKGKKERKNMCQKAKGLLESPKYLLSDPSQTSGLDNKFVSLHYSRQHSRCFIRPLHCLRKEHPLWVPSPQKKGTHCRTENRKQKTTLVKQDGSDKDAQLPFPLESVRWAEATRFQQKQGQGGRKTL